MSVVWLQIAAVNFATTIYDTNDLSIIRGGSFAVLQSADDLLDDLCRRLADRAAVARLYSGASEAVLRIAPKQAATSPVKLEPPGGGKQQWRDKTLPALAARVRAGEPLDEVAASARAGFPKPKISAPAIARQIEFVLERDASGEGAGAALSDAEIEDLIVKALAAHEPTLRHFTVAHARHRPAPGESLQAVLATLATRIRVAQLQSLTVVLPDRVSTLAEAGDAFCPFTLGRQPAEPRLKLKGKPASASAYARHAIGRDRKTSFYQEQINRGMQAAKVLGNERAAPLEHARRALVLQGMPLAMDFGELVADPPPRLPPNVEGKLAVLFMDGNGFGALRQKCAEISDRKRSIEPFRRFCLALEQNNAIVLGDLVDWMLQAPGFTHGSGAARKLRFETLLWGGDDVSMVLPAWGLAPFLEQLETVLKSLRLPVGDNHVTPTYKIGIVLAQHKSPIRDLRMAAEKLADAAKATSAEKSVVQIMALEGIDRAEFDPARVRTELFGDVLGHEPGAFGMFLDDWPEIVRLHRKIGDTVGRSQLHRWYREAEHKNLLRLDRSDPAVAAFAADFAARLHDFRIDDDLVRALTGQTTVLARGGDRWPLLPLYHVLTLADYVTASDVPAATRPAAA